MKILAFMQNQWFKNAELYRRKDAHWKAQGLTQWLAYRESFIKRALFFRCRSGQVLTSYLGEELCNRIIWDEASPEIGDNPSHCPPADPEHIKAVLEYHKPRVVAAFGRIAQGGVNPVILAGSEEIHYLPLPHPACRAPKDHAALKEACRRLKQLI